jgi:hypothetical protein
LDGREIGTGSDLRSGGDICRVVCPGDIDKIADLTGSSVGQIYWEFGAGPTGAGGYIYVRAFRFPAAATNLVRAWENIVSGWGPMWDSSDATIGGRNVLVIGNALRTDPDAVQYTFAVGQVLYVVSGLPLSADPRLPDASIVAAIRALPVDEPTE